MKSIIIFLYLTMMVIFAQAQVDGQLYTCVGPYCQPGGAWGDSSAGGVAYGDSPLYSTGNQALDNARWEAYRYEMSPGYQQAVAKLNGAVEQWAKEKQQAENLSVEEFQKLKKQALEKLSRSLPPVPSQLPSIAERRAQNPYPSESAKKDLDSKLDNIWKNIKTGSPLAVAKSVQLEQAKYIIPPGTSAEVSHEMKKRYDFLNKELVLSRVIDNQGLLNVPFVEKPDVRLKTQGHTEIGNRLRGDLNRTFANQSMTYAKCQQPNADVSACEQVQDFNQAATVSLYAMDRWGASFDNGSVSDQYNYILKAMERELAFVDGFLERGEELVKGALQTAAHPLDTTSALASAIWNFDTTYTALEQVVTNKWEDYLVANDVERARILGQASFEVLSALVPSSKLGWVGKVTSASPLMMLNLTRDTVEVAYIATKIGVKNVDELSSLMRMQREMMINAGMRAQLVRGSLQNLTRNSFEAYSLTVKEMGSALTPSAHNYLAKQVGYTSKILKNGEEFSAEKLNSMAKSYIIIEKKLETVAGVSVDEMVTRALPKNLGVTGENIFKVHDFSLLSNNRFSPPGELALHAVIGEGDVARRVAAAENELSQNALEFAQKRIKLDDVLDLTDPKVLHVLKTTTDEITMSNYILTQQIGHAAQYKFKGIKAPAAPDKMVSNLIIFGGN